MKIYFERTGGFMGRTICTEVDTNQIPPEQALSILEKIDDAGFFDLPGTLDTGLESASGAADQLCYKVTVEVAGVQHTVETSDVNAPEQLQPLLKELTEYTRRSGQSSASASVDPSNSSR
jgi:hypothetical protein